MKRDWNILRAILQEAEAGTLYESMRLIESHKSNGAGILDQATAGLDEADKPKTIAGHIRLLAESGMLKGVDIQGEADVCFGRCYITMQGYDLLDCLRTEGTWNHILRASGRFGIALSFETIKELAVNFVHRAL